MMWKIRAALVIASIISLAGIALYSYNSGKQAGMEKVQNLWDKEVAQMAQAQAEEQAKARQREQALQAQIDRQRRAHREEVNRITSEFTADIDRLRDRAEERAGVGGVPEGSVSGVGCTGEGLARGDASFLAGFAADAARTQAALNACIAAYDEVRRQLND